MTTADLALKALAETATPGERLQMAGKYMSFDRGETPQVFRAITQADEDFITACSPERILALLARVEKLEAALRLTYGGPLPLTANDRAQIEAALADAEVTK